MGTYWALCQVQEAQRCARWTRSLSSWGSSYWEVHIITQLGGTVLRKMLSAEEGSKVASWRKGHLIPSLKDKSSRNQEWGGSRKE